jgi:hypothetical protein
MSKSNLNRVAGMLLSLLSVVLVGVAVGSGSASATTVPSAENGCYATAVHGGLILGYNQENDGGPNFTSGVCNDINIKLTSADHPTFAQACLQTSSGLNCPAQWTQLPLGSWTVLRSSVLGKTKWVLKMKATGPEDARFDYTA